jgi:hypothetical protein
MSHPNELAPLLPFHPEGISIPDLRSTRAPRSEKPQAHLYKSAPVLAFRPKHSHPEPEDARITGMTRSLYRRLLALNLRKTPASVAAADDLAASPLSA